MRFYVEAPVNGVRKCGIVEAKSHLDVVNAIEDELKLSNLRGLIVRLATRKDEEWIAKQEAQCQSNTD